MKDLVKLILALAVIIQVAGCKKEIKPVDKMEWWKEAKFGMFIHWGIFSVPAGEYNGKEIDGYAEWLMNNAKVPVTEYEKYAAQFNPTDFDADSWVKLAKEAGMKYIVITSKHHDGFAMFDSKVSTYDIIDATPFKTDVIKEMAEACKKHNMPFGLYYSQAQDWYVPGGAAMGGQWDAAQQGSMDEYLDKVAVPQVSEILNNYGDIKILWWDTPTDMTPERAAKFMPELVKHPNLICNNRLGGDVDGDLDTPEQFIPATGIPGKNWESCMTMNDSWGFKTNDHNWKSAEMLVRNLIDIVSKGGNYLLNVGPTRMGIIPDPSIERLKEVGSWMNTNKEAIYGTTASPFKKLDWGRCTVKNDGDKTLLYLHIFEFPENETLLVPGLASHVKKAYTLKNKREKLSFETIGNNVAITISGVEKDQFATVIVLEISEELVVYNGPEITSDYSIFIDEAKFKVSTDIPNSIIRYTTDGSIPTNESTKADGINIVMADSSFVVKAMCFVDGKAISGLVEKSFTKANPTEAVNANKTTPGLRYSYYEGKWTLLPDFSALKPISSGIAKTIELAMKKRNENYGVVFKGYIDVPETGVYQFILTSDDGSRMIISGNTLLNDGLHGKEDKMLDVALSKGLHPIEIQFFQNGGGDGLDLKWKTNHKASEVIAAENFSH
jgi:alpha-L-fucosidase